jgi:hypothetical protein
MFGTLRRKRLLAPLLCGSLLSGGCYLFGPETGQFPQSGAVNDKAVGQDGQPGTGTGQSPKPGALPERHPPDVPPPVPDSQAKDATSTVGYLAPTGGQSPYSPIYGPSGPAVSRQAGDPRSSNVVPVENRTGGESDQPTSYNGSDIDSYRARVQQLEKSLEQRERAAKRSIAELQAAAEELQRTRADLAAARKEADDLRARMRDRERENNEALRAYCNKIEQLLGEAPPEAAPKPVPPKGQ